MWIFLVVFMGLIIAIFKHKQKYTIVAMGKTGAELDRKRGQIREMYPSNISWRGFLVDSDNTFQKNLLVYMVAEDNSLYFVDDMDMLVKYQITINNINQFEKVKLNDLYSNTDLSIPDVEFDPGLPVFMIAHTNEQDDHLVWYFFFESSESSFMYNRLIPGQDTVLTYVKSQIRKNKR